MAIPSEIKAAAEALQRLRDLYALAADREKDRDALAFLIALSVDAQRGLLSLWDRMARARGEKAFSGAVPVSALKAPPPAPAGPAAALAPDMEKRLAFYRRALQEEKKVPSSARVPIIERIIEHLAVRGRLPDPAALTGGD